MVKRGNPGLKGKLINKSIEAYILALETINRLSITYRIETFAYLICNAWELILKAKLLDLASNKQSAIYYKKTKRGEQKRTLSLRDCLGKIFLNEKEPIRRNIELIADLRDECVHLVICEVPKEILALFQSSVLEYHKYLVKWFDISLSNRVSAGMMTVVYDFNPAEFDLANPILRRNLGIETANYLIKYQAELKKEYDQLGKAAEFSISIDYKLRLTKSGSPDLELTSGKGGELIGFVEVPKDPSKTHPHRLKDVEKIINKFLPEAEKIGQYDITCIQSIFDTKKNQSHYYKGSIKGSPMQYSQEFIDWVLNKYKNNPDFFTETRQQFKNNRNS